MLKLVAHILSGIDSNARILVVGRVVKAGYFEVFQNTFTQLEFFYKYIIL
jgi:hypothetical protein